jgi:hypothetical protein
MVGRPSVRCPADDALAQRFVEHVASVWPAGGLTVDAVRLDALDEQDAALDAAVRAIDLLEQDETIAAPNLVAVAKR